jgi:hypothetical protein
VSEDSFTYHFYDLVQSCRLGLMLTYVTIYDINKDFSRYQMLIYFHKDEGK